MAEMYKVRDPEIEATLKEIGDMVGSSLPKSHGFALFIFGYEDHNLFYISSADRESLVRTLQEFIQKFRPN